MKGAKWFLLLLVIVLATGAVFSCAGEEEAVEPVKEEADEENKEQPSNDLDKEKDETSFDHETTFEHEVNKEINGEVRYDQGEEWWKLNGEEEESDE